MSSAFVPVATMAAWLQPIAEASPVTVVVNATRGPFLGVADVGMVFGAAAWIVGLAVVFAPLAIWTFRRPR